MMAVLLVLLVFVLRPAFAFGPYDIDVIKVLDGDTVRVDVHLWPGLRQRVDVRLFGINAPEVHTRQKCQKDLGIKARDALVRLLASGRPVLTAIDPASTKYAGRINGVITVNGVDASAWLLERGYAVPYSGGKRSRQWPCD